MTAHHHWQVALLMMITDDEALAFARHDRAVVDEDRRVEVADIFCRRCLGRFTASDDECISFSEQMDELIRTHRKQQAQEVAYENRLDASRSRKKVR